MEALCGLSIDICLGNKENRIISNAMHRDPREKMKVMDRWQVAGGRCVRRLGLGLGSAPRCQRVLSRFLL